MSAPDGAVGGGGEEFEALLKGVLAGDSSGIETASEENLRRLESELSAYTHVVRADDDGERVRHLACSVTEMREDHIEKLTMTSLIGFIFRMYKEWEVPPEARRWKPEDHKVDRKRREPALSPEALAALATKLAKAAGEAVEAEKAAQAATLKAKDADIFQFANALDSDGAESKAQAEKDKILATELAEQARAARGMADGLRYTAHRVACEIGRLGTAGLSRAAEHAKKHPEIRELVEKDPVLAEAECDEAPPAVAKEIIGQFLRTWFEYDPDLHVRAASNASRDGRLEEFKKGDPAKKRDAMATGAARPFLSDLDDPERLTLFALQGSISEVPEALREAFAVSVANPRARAAVKHVLSDPSLRAALAPVVADDEMTQVLRQYLSPIEATERFSQGPASAADSTTTDSVTADTATDSADTAANAATDSAADTATDSAADAATDSDTAPSARGLAGVREAVEVVPPADTFHRWGYYRDVNFEELRDAAEALYGLKFDLDLAIAPFEVFEGTESTAAEAFQKYKAAHADSLRSNLLSLTFGRWNLTGPWKENRKRIDFYNQHTRIIQKILERHEEDKKLGAELMKKRVVKAKAKNIAEAGPDDPGLASYAATMGTAEGEKVIDGKLMNLLNRSGGNEARVRETEDFQALLKERDVFTQREKVRPLTDSETEQVAELDGRIKTAREMLEVPDDAIQVDVFENSGSDFVKSKFYTKAVKPEAPSGGAGARAGGAASGAKLTAGAKVPPRVMDA